MPYGDDGHRALGRRPTGWGGSSSASSTSGCGATSARCSSSCSTSRSPTGTASPSGLCVHTASCGDGAGHGVQRRRLRLRPLRRAGVPARQHPRAAPRGARRRARAAAASATASRQRCRGTAASATCASPATAAAPRTASSTTAGRGAGAQLPLPRLQGVLPPRRRADAPHVRAAARGARAGGHRRRVPRHASSGPLQPGEPGRRPKRQLSHPGDHSVSMARTARAGRPRIEGGSMATEQAGADDHARHGGSRRGRATAASSPFAPPPGQRTPAAGAGSSSP